MNILSDDTIIHFGKDDLPVLINGKQGTGSSFFTVMLAVDAFREGSKLLFFSAFHMAKDDLLNELTQEEKDRVEFLAKGETPLGKQLIVISTGDESTLLSALNTIPDIQERVIVVKNIDNYSRAVFEKAKKFPLVILSGDIDNSSFGTEINLDLFRTKIFFSWPNRYSTEHRPEPEKYHGICIKNGVESSISLKK